MKSSRGRSGIAWGALLCAVGAAAAIGLVRPSLLEHYDRVSTDADVYALPSPEQTTVLSLGYRAALADALFASVLVSYGLHFQERRRFEFVGNYLETINTLDPTFGAPYRYADTLLTLQPVPPRWEDFVKAREILERGMRERPRDGELHTNAGLFFAYLAPSQAPNEAVKKEWRLTGARTLARGCELIGDDANLPYHCVVAADLFTRAGEQEATIGFLQRFLAITDDEGVRRIALGQLRKVVGEREQARFTRRIDALNEAWGRDLPFVRKDMLLIIGPPTSPWRCTGTDASADCASSWRDWGRHQR
ncbi:MAG: hypothetical protein R3B13_28975 [Polyangiaceae bacterium]